MGHSPKPAEAVLTAILIVEDDVLANENMEFILQQAGYDVLSHDECPTKKRRSCLKISKDVQLLVTDVDLPGTSKSSEIRCCREGPTARDKNHIITTDYVRLRTTRSREGGRFSSFLAAATISSSDAWASGVSATRRLTRST